MNKKLFIPVAAAIVLCATACNKPTPTPDPGPTPDPPTPSEITSNNAAPGGFVDGGAESWD